MRHILAHCGSFLEGGGGAAVGWRGGGVGTKTPAPRKYKPFAAVSSALEHTSKVPLWLFRRRAGGGGLGEGGWGGGGGVVSSPFFCSQVQLGGDPVFASTNNHNHNRQQTAATATPAKTVTKTTRITVAMTVPRPVVVIF